MRLVSVFSELHYTLGSCDKLKVLVLLAHASDHIDLFQRQPHSILILGRTQHIGCKHLTRVKERHLCYLTVILGQISPQHEVCNEPTTVGA